MPRQRIDLGQDIEELSILDEHGEVDEALDPSLNHDELLRLYRAMILSRRLDERMIKMQRQGQMGTFAPTRGQEAAQLGAVYPLRTDDWYAPSYRSAGAQVWRGWPIERILMLWNGLADGFRPPDEINDLPMSIVVGSHPPVATGVAMAVKNRQADQVVMTNFGDGASSEGDVYEALNFAAVYDAPVVFVVENNQYAISIPVARQTRSKTFAQKALAVGMPGIKVDGNDLLAMIVASREAVDRARSGDGPTLIEAYTFRLEMHTTADDPTRYRGDEEVERWLPKDPVLRMEKYLRRIGAADQRALDEMGTDVDEELQAARARYEELNVPDPRDVFDYVYAELPPELAEQRTEYLQRLDGIARG